jgi:hypothetical protein
MKKKKQVRKKRFQTAADVRRAVPPVIQNKQQQGKSVRKQQHTNDENCGIFWLWAVLFIFAQSIPPN